MKISIFNNFGAQNSQPVFEAIAKGLQRLGHTVVSHDHAADAAVIWSMLWAGRMRNNRAVYEHFQQQGRPVIVAEVGMIQRNRTWKLGLGGTEFENYPAHVDDNQRASRLGIRLQPWKTSGSNIVIACQRTDSEQWHGQPPLNQWLSNTVDAIRRYSDRPIIVRPHPRGSVPVIAGCCIEKPRHISNTYDDFDFASSLGNVWAVVNHNSGPGSQAIINGVPAFVDQTSLASPVGNLDFSTIETPQCPDRESWSNWLAHSEWTTDEIKAGSPLERLLNTL